MGGYIFHAFYVGPVKLQIILGRLGWSAVCRPFAGLPSLDGKHDEKLRGLGLQVPEDSVKVDGTFVNLKVNPFRASLGASWYNEVRRVANCY